MFGALLAILSAVPVIGGLFKWLAGALGTSQPPAVQEGEKLGAADQALQTETQTNEQVAAAVAASNAADLASVRNPNSLREPDPDSRD